MKITIYISLGKFKKMLSVNVCLVKIDQLMDSKND